MKRSRTVPLALVICGALMLLVGGFGIWKAIDLRDAGASRNVALVDVDATARVQAEVNQALTQILSYDHTAPDATAEAASAVLDGEAKSQYDTLFSTLKEKAADQELKLTATVAVSAVKSLSDDRAELLVFLDQSSKRAKDKEARLAAAQIAVTAEKSGGRWLITSLRPL